MGKFFERADPARTAQRGRDRWKWPVLAALVVTIPAFYLELVSPAPWPIATGLYIVAAAVTGFALWWSRHQAAVRHAREHAHWPQWLLTAGLLLSAALPPSSESTPALTFRLIVALATLARMSWLLRYLLTQGSVVYMLGLALALVGLSGLGFWWLEPTAETLADGLWLAFTTAATVGYGDIVPTTPASKIFSFFVVLIGFGVLSLVTASIAAMWIESEERRIEREILRDLNSQMREVRTEIAALREMISASRSAPVWAKPPIALGSEADSERQAL
jgi:voltage-gated potassium channel